MFDRKKHWLVLFDDYRTMSNRRREDYWTLTVASFTREVEAEKNGRHFPDDIFKCIFFNENVWIFIKISLKFVPRGQINNIPEVVRIMAWRRPGDKPLSEPMMVNVLTHICVTRPQWVNPRLAQTPIGFQRALSYSWVNILSKRGHWAQFRIGRS